MRPETARSGIELFRRDRTRLDAMKYVLTIGIVAAVLIGISKLRQRDDADLWHEVTTR